MKKVVLVTGGFDPIHSGHIAYFNAARELGDFDEDYDPTDDPGAEY